MSIRLTQHQNDGIQVIETFFLHLIKFERAFNSTAGEHMKLEYQTGLWVNNMFPLSI